MYVNLFKLAFRVTLLRSYRIQFMTPWVIAAFGTNCPTASILMSVCGVQSRVKELSKDFLRTSYL
jgi:hypothetical protein